MAAGDEREPNQAATAPPAGDDLVVRLSWPGVPPPSGDEMVQPAGSDAVGGEDDHGGAFTVPASRPVDPSPPENASPVAVPAGEASPVYEPVRSGSELAALAVQIEALQHATALLRLVIGDRLADYANDVARNQSLMTRDLADFRAETSRDLATLHNALVRQSDAVSRLEQSLINFDARIAALEGTVGSGLARQREEIAQALDRHNGEIGRALQSQSEQLGAALERRAGEIARALHGASDQLETAIQSQADEVRQAIQAQAERVGRAVQGWDAKLAGLDDRVAGGLARQARRTDQALSSWEGRLVEMDRQLGALGAHLESSGAVAGRVAGLRADLDRLAGDLEALPGQVASTGAVQALAEEVARMGVAMDALRRRIPLRARASEPVIDERTIEMIAAAVSRRLVDQEHGGSSPGGRPAADQSPGGRPAADQPAAAGQTLAPPGAGAPPPSGAPAGPAPTPAPRKRFWRRS